jgi:hypothetical protein
MGCPELKRSVNRSKAITAKAAAVAKNDERPQNVRSRP